MRLRMVCPQYSTVIHARRSVCECGHAFTLKREGRITASSPVKRKRALESLEDTLRRQESNRTRIASMRASETLHIKLHKRRKNKEAMANARTRTVLIESAIAAFHSEVKLGPEFVCTCCRRMMYRKSVVVCNKGKYTKTSTDVLHKVFSPDYSYISFGGKEWMCKTCDRALRRGCIPVQAKANGLQLSNVPPELSGLNPLELRLICHHFCTTLLQTDSDNI